MKTGCRLLEQRLKATSFSIKASYFYGQSGSSSHYTIYSSVSWILVPYDEDGNFSHKEVWDSISDFNEVQTTKELFKIRVQKADYVGISSM